ncbi:hypothetical protein K388_06015 [Streptomyces sp. KhCrAH-43]|uniref:DUF6197 family protein n=1 Tax=unclassified Streptomyces TaxID=2593676 RepID=UPI00035E65EC|nr:MULTISPECIES: DUF6197 family protein [unclassified Streptomyces]MYS33673.1 hypothetical protein [Streptomyces sp. SID4920]MYX63734.1 hypothetical protein [Streptomyces sp. SID8373]RAJ52915.1 hypothetical protein K388_06015 [Streptomyces sp. KhCrAH-43]
MTLRYSTESTLLPTNAPDLLDWAAAHIENRGFYDGREGGRFGKNGTTIRYLVPSMVGAFDVAAGYGRRSSTRTYDYPALYAAERLALDVLSDYLAGGAMPHDPNWEDENHRRFIVQDWGRRDGRTRDEAAEAFRHAARLAERAQAAAVRPGRLPRPLHPITASGLLEWAAAHLEDVTMRPGGLTHDPDGFANTAPCTLLHAVDRALRIAKPIPADGHLLFRAFHQAQESALQELSSRLAGHDITAGPDEPAYDVVRRRRSTILSWGNQPDRAEGEAVQELQAAALAVADEAQAEPELERQPEESVLF